MLNVLYRTIMRFAGMTHIYVTSITASVKMIGREFCSLMSVQMQKLVSKETTLTSCLRFFICTFV